MASTKGSSNMRNLMFSGKHALLPPKSPFPSVSSGYVDYAGPPIGSKAIGKPKEVSSRHQRTLSESLLIEEQPSWLDDLLNEPETPARKGGHRRSSSDSFAYLDIANISNMEHGAQKEQMLKNAITVPSWGPPDLDCHEDGRHAPLIAETNSTKLKNGVWESSLSVINHPSCVASMKDNVAMRNSGPSCSSQEFDGVLSTGSQKQDPAEASSNNPKSSDKRESGQGKSSASETDTKRAKQQFAQRSRVRKLHYIAELERSVQALQVEGSEVSAELEFLNQQNLILSMENKALQQRLESLSQEQMIKYLEQEVLEREIGRLRTLYQQQQQPLQPPQHQQKQPSSGHRRNNSKDLDLQFAKLSLKHKDANSGHDNVSGSLRI